MIKIIQKISTAILISMMLYELSASQSYWESIYGGTGSDAAVALLPSQDGNYLIVGTTVSSAYVVKVNTTGDMIWTKSIYHVGGFSVECVIPTQDSNFLIVGETDLSDRSGECICLLKIKQNGDTIWSKTYEEISTDYAPCVTTTQDGNYLVGGSKTFFTDNRSGFLMKIRPNGDSIWVKNISLPVYAIIKNQDGNFLVEGDKNIQPSVGANYSNIMVGEIDMSGNLLWTKTYGGADETHPRRIIATQDGKYLVFGNSRSFTDFNDDFYVIKIEPNGDVIWNKNYGGPLNDYPCAITPSYDGNYLIAGQSHSGGGNCPKIIKIKPNGDLVWTRNFGGTIYDQVSAITATPDGNCLFAGRTCFKDSLGDAYLRSFVDFRRAYKDKLFTFETLSTSDTLNYGFVLLKAPEGMIVSTGGTIQWTPPSIGSAYSVPVSYLIINDNGQKDTVSFDILVNSNVFPEKIPNLKPCINNKVLQNMITVQRVTSKEVSFSLPPSILSLSIFSMTGQLLEYIPVHGNHCSWRSEQANGKYFALAKDGKSVFTKSFLLLK